MRTRILGLMMLAALFVVAGKPQAQPTADDPVIPQPIIQDNGPGTQVILASTNRAITKAETAVSHEPVASPATQPTPAASDSAGAIPLPSTAFQVCYLFYPDQESSEGVVLWRAIGEGAKFDVAEIRARIRLQGGQNLKGIYAMQPDYRVQKISLSAQETSHVLDLIKQNSDGKTLLSDTIWKPKVNGSLKEVEYEAERSKELRKLAAQKSRQSKKTSAVASKSRTSKSTKAKPATKPATKTSASKKKTSTSRAS